MRRMNKSGMGAIETTMTIIGSVIALILLIALLVHFRIPQRLGLVIPDYSAGSGGQYDNSVLGCNIHVAILDGNGYINFCVDKECKSAKKSLVYKSGEEIKVNDGYISDTVIGLVNEGGYIYLDLKKVKIGVLSFEEKSNLNEAYFLNKNEICRDSTPKIYGEIKKDNVKSIVLSDGKTFYYDRDELARNMGIGNTVLYLDDGLTKKANSFMDKGGSAHREKEVGDADIFKARVYLNSMGEVPKLIQNDLYDSLSEKTDGGLSWRVSVSGLEEGMVDPGIKLKTPISNKDDILGVDTGGYDYSKVSFYKSGGRIYVSFSTGRTGFLYLGTIYYSPWILKEYWDIHQTFANAPSDVLIEEGKDE